MKEMDYRKKKPTVDELVQEWKTGNRREVARYLNKSNKFVGMRFAIAFIILFTPDKINTVFALMESEREKKFMRG